jgi:hypothetical protein
MGIIKKYWNINFRNIKYGTTAHNRTVCASPPVGGSGSVKPQLAHCAFVGFYSTTFFCAHKMLRIFLIGHKKTAHTAGTLHENFFTPHLFTQAPSMAHEIYKNIY